MTLRPLIQPQGQHPKGQFPQGQRRAPAKLHCLHPGVMALAPATGVLRPLPGVHPRLLELAWEPEPA
jgi:hypothetical protein